MYTFTGLGRSLAMTPCPILLGYYFDKRRSLAFGIASAGFSIGGFAITPLIELLFQEYGYSGAFLILTAFTMNIFVAAVLFRPLQADSKRGKCSKLVNAFNRTHNCYKYTLLKHV